MGHTAVADLTDLPHTSLAEEERGNIARSVFTANPKEQINQLTSAFLRFDQTTQRLERAYIKLKRRAAKIDRELAETNERLNKKVEELASLTAYLNNILESMHSGLIAINQQGLITTFNRAAEKLLGISAKDAIKSNYDDIMKYVSSDPSSQTNPKIIPLAIRALRYRRSYTDVECKIVRAGGQVITVESTAAPLKNSNDETIGAVEIFRDLTEIRELQERLYRADKLAALGEMAAKLAHEIRNPLNGIEGFAALLAREFDENDKRNKFALNIVQGTRNLNETLTNMLNYAQPIHLRLEKATLSEICDSVLLFAHEEMRHNDINNIKVDRRYDYSIDKIMVDPYQLKQALLNLVLNAIQSMSSSKVNGGQLVISTKQLSPEWVRISISDTGPGIDTDIQKKIFDPFFTTKSNGTGLGLAIVHKIVELHGGKLTLESTQQKGTIFSLDLPIGHNG